MPHWPFSLGSFSLLPSLPVHSLCGLPTIFLLPEQFPNCSVLLQGSPLSAARSGPFLFSGTPPFLSCLAVGWNTIISDGQLESLLHSLSSCLRLHCVCICIHLPPGRVAEWDSHFHLGKDVRDKNKEVEIHSPVPAVIQTKMVQITSSAPVSQSIADVFCLLWLWKRTF